VEVQAFQFSSPTSSQIILLIVVLVVVGVGFFIAARKAAGGKKKKDGAGPGWRSFYQIAKQRGLTKQETERLKRLVVAHKLSRPALIFTSTNILDSCIQRTVRKLSLAEAKGESKEDVINAYYRLRNKISRTRSGTLTSTKQIAVGTNMQLQVEKHGSYSVSVNSNEEDYLGISIPVLPPGKIVPWDKKKVKCTVWENDDTGYNFLSRVDDVKVSDDIQCLCLKHTDTIGKSQRRLYPRKSVRMPVFFSRVRVVEEGGKKKAIVDKKDTHWGTVTDLSVGGMTVETTVPIDRNRFLRIEFELKEDYRLVAFGKVRRIEKNSARKTWLMHIQFTKIDKKYKNDIFAVLYDYQAL